MSNYDTKKDVIKRIKERNYLSKDYDSFRSDLVTYKRNFFPNTTQDSSDASFDGLLMDMPAYVGDVVSFYLDHQFHELDPQSAIEPRNIQRHLERSNVPIVGASPAVVTQKVYIEVPADSSTGTPLPSTSALPKLFAGTVATANNGTQFEFTEDVDFNDVDEDGKLLATVAIGQTNATNTPTTFILSREVLCISGKRYTETMSIGAFSPFLRQTLAQPDISDIISIYDSYGNQYYQVDFLTQDTVYKALPNLNRDMHVVKDILVPMPAPYRFTSKMDVNTKLTTITFGGGSAETTNDDLFPDPSQFAVPLYGKRVFSRFTLNPGNMMQTNTLGTVKPNSTITITYRYGGGLSHNVPKNSIKNITSLQITFPNNPSNSIAQFVRNSISTTNEKDASGGEDAPTIDELKARIPQYLNAQGRIASKPDLLARLYTMPANFGRVFRAAVHPNQNNPLASQIYIVSRDSTNKLTISPDSLKTNIVKYINEYRLTSDALDILDAKIINLKINFSVVVDPLANRNAVIGTIINRLQQFFSVKKFDIDQPLVKGDLHNLIYNNVGVISVNSIVVSNQTGTSTQSATGTTSPRTYSDVQFDVDANTYKGIIFPPIGGIFEVKYLNFDIVGIAI